VVLLRFCLCCGTSQQEKKNKRKMGLGEKRPSNIKNNQYEMHYIILKEQKKKNPSNSQLTAP